MIDPRFYEHLGPVSVRALAGDLPWTGDGDLHIHGAAPADQAGAADLCYLERLADGAVAPTAGAMIAPEALASAAPRVGAVIIAARPRAAFARLAPRLVRPRRLESGILIHESAAIEAGARLGPGVVVGQGARIGAEAEIGPHAVIGPGVAIGRRTRIGAHAAISFALIGDDVTILSGAVIGEQGFGVAADSGGLVDVPHLGRVIIQDRATIGANCTIDRGVFDDTVIGEEAKLDNLCHVAHQVKIGRGVLIAAFGGISGSTSIGDGVVMGGRVGVGDHRQVGARAVLAAGAAVLQDVPAGETWGGYPAKPLRKFLRETAWLSRKAGSRNGGD